MHQKLQLDPWNPLGESEERSWQFGFTSHFSWTMWWSPRLLTLMNVYYIYIYIFVYPGSPKTKLCPLVVGNS